MKIISHVLNNVWLLILILSLVQIWYLGSCDIADFSEDRDFYTYTVTDISGNQVSLEKYRGKVSLVVNVASQCGYTYSHYHALNLLQEHFGSTEKFNILAFPCNQFGHQEPGTDKDILHFARKTMDANFPMFAKVNVKDRDTSPAWNYLTKYSGQTPTWNFWKYLVDHNGLVINAWGPSMNPDHLYQEIQAAISNIDTDPSNRRQESMEEL